MEKTKTEIRQTILSNLANKTGVNITEDGSIAVAIVDSIIDEIYSLYYELDMMKQEAYLSTSHGMYTELIADLVDTDRNPAENDSELKLRASNSIYRHAKGNRIAIEEAALAVSGVASIDYRPYGAGTGSFVLYVYPQAGVNQIRLLDRVEAAVGQVVAEGIYFEVRQPTEKPVDVSLILQFDNRISVMEKQAVRNSVRYRIVNYLNGLKKDEVLYVNEIIRLVMGTNVHILDLAIADLKVNGLAKTITNTFPANDERFISGTVTVA